MFAGFPKVCYVIQQAPFIYKYLVLKAYLFEFETADHNNNHKSEILPLWFWDFISFCFIYSAPGPEFQIFDMKM